MIAPGDVRWSRQAAGTSRRQLVLWTAAALVTMSAHAGAAWVALGFDRERPAELVAGGAIEIDMAALGFAEADQLSAGAASDAVEPTEAEPVEPVDAATPVEHAETAASVEPVETATRVEDAETPEETRPEVATQPPVTPVEQAKPVEEQPAAQPVAETPPIESPRASDVQIAAASPVAPVEPERTEPLTEQAVSAPVDEIEPIEEEQVAALMHVPLPTPRPAYTPAAMPRVERPKDEPQRQAEAPRRKEAPQQKKAQTAPPKNSGSGGQNQADTRKGTADGSATSRAEAKGKSGSSQAGNAAVSNYPGKVSSRLRRALRYPAAAKRERLRGEVHVSFTVNSAGGVGSVRVARSSGSQVLDQAALETVRRAAPFPPIPAGAGRSSWPFTVPLSFTR